MAHEWSRLRDSVVTYFRTEPAPGQTVRGERIVDARTLHGRLRDSRRAHWRCRRCGTSMSLPACSSGPAAERGSSGPRDCDEALASGVLGS